MSGYQQQQIIPPSGQPQYPMFPNQFNGHMNNSFGPKIPVKQPLMPGPNGTNPFATQVPQIGGQQYVNQSQYQPSPQQTPNQHQYGGQQMYMPGPGESQPRTASYYQPNPQVQPPQEQPQMNMMNGMNMMMTPQQQPMYQTQSPKLPQQPSNNNQIDNNQQAFGEVTTQLTEEIKMIKEENEELEKEIAENNELITILQNQVNGLTDTVNEIFRLLTTE